MAVADIDVDIMDKNRTLISEHTDAAVPIRSVSTMNFYYAF